MKRNIFLLVLFSAVSAFAIGPGSPIAFDVAVKNATVMSQAGTVDSFPHVANEAARLSLLNLATDGTYQVIQDSNATTYTYNAVTVEAVQVIGAGTAEANGFYTKRGTVNGKNYYNLVGKPDEAGSFSIKWADDIWSIRTESDVVYNSADAVARPDLVTTWTLADGSNPVPTTARVTSKDSILTCVFVSGANGDSTEANGVFTVRGVSNGKPYYNLVGQSDDAAIYSVEWIAAAWKITASDGDILFASASNTTYPWQASGWAAVTNVLDTPPTVASLVYGKLIAGVSRSGVIRKVNGATVGRNKYTDLAAVATDITWTGSQWSDGTNTGTDTAVPFDGGLGTRDNISVLENWNTVP